jgi:hypothetical protein
LREHLKASSTPRGGNALARNIGDPGDGLEGENLMDGDNTQPSYPSCLLPNHNPLHTQVFL